jgi:NADP-dependent 3-hydroxy acid dehydrogenase YdfG
MFNGRTSEGEEMAQPEWSFKGRTAVVTGAGTGVGAALALVLGEAGATVHLIGRRPDRLQSVADRIHSAGGLAICHPGDLSTIDGQENLAHRMELELSGLDILVQNAATYSAGSIADTDPLEFDKLYQTNIRAPYLLTRSLLPMLQLRRGQVVFINSSSGITAKPSTAQYDATKHALKAIADSLRGEVNQLGIRVLSVYLGRTATDLQERLHRLEGKAYRPELLLQPADVASIVMTALSLPATAEVTDIHIRPMVKT